MKHGTVIYDGECGFCRSQIERLRACDSALAFEYLPKRTPGLDERFPFMKTAEFSKGLRFVDSSGEVHIGADAFYQMARRLPGWNRIAWLYRVPGIRPAARAIYAVIAANRQRL